MRLRDWAEIPRLAHAYVEAYGISYLEAVKRAKEKLLTDRVGAHKSVNSDSKETKNSISFHEDIDNGEIYNIETRETIREL